MEPGSDLDRNIGGPLLVGWGDNVLVGGRKHIAPEFAVTALYWLTDARLQEAAELPSAGDNSYPGFVELSPTSGLLSFLLQPSRHRLRLIQHRRAGCASRRHRV
ncbi:MAG: hypothetical protein OXJ90_25810 [Spirochaetaceae bacterium]|nr:hypothetical protein [Spirochaetaceae bacterium]